MTRKLAREAAIFALAGFAGYIVLSDLYNWANIPYLYTVSRLDQLIEGLPFAITHGLIIGMLFGVVVWALLRLVRFAVKG